MFHSLSGFVFYALLSGLGRYKVNSGSRSVSDGMSEFEGFLDQDLLVP
jgi:hypothetical protein